MCMQCPRGGSEKSDSVGGFENPPFFTNGVWRVFKGFFFDADTPNLRIFFWCYSFGLHMQSFVLAPNSATFDFVPLARDPPSCKGDIAYQRFFGHF